MRFLLLFFVLIAVPFGAISQTETQSLDETEEEAVEPVRINAPPTRIVLDLGQQTVVHGLQGDCGVLPTVENQAETQTTKLGYLVLGRPGVMQSVVCKGETPAFEVIYVPQRTGRETLRLFGTQIRVRVRRNRDDD